jgi:hypothetical protein
MRNSAQKRASWTNFAALTSHDRLAGIRDQRFGNAETGHMARAMTGKDAVRSFCLNELDLDDRRARLIHTGDTAARHRFQGEQRHSCSAVACGGEGNVHLSG